ncbi:MAG: DinB family protein [Chloroflexota bacterium]
MIIRVGVENNNEGYRSIAWALEHPGCYAYGPDADQALDNLLVAIQEYAAWIGGHEPVWFDPQEPELILEETFNDYDVNADLDIVEKGEYTVEPFFQYEWKPLTAPDLETALKLLAWSRADLLTLLETLTPDQWAFKGEGERWDVAGIVRHIGGAEWWYVDRLGLAFPREDVPKEPLERLEKTRARMLEVLPSLLEVKQVNGLEGELWSPRKVVRRAAWHERDHTDHIRKLVNLI